MPEKSADHLTVIGAFRLKTKNQPLSKLSTF
jgi:hypothetical protein